MTLTEPNDCKELWTFKPCNCFPNIMGPWLVTLGIFKVFCEKLAGEIKVFELVKVVAEPTSSLLYRAVDFLTRKSSKRSILRFERGTKSIFDPKIVENIDFLVLERYYITVQTSIQDRPVFE